VGFGYFSLVGPRELHLQVEIVESRNGRTGLRRPPLPHRCSRAQRLKHGHGLVDEPWRRGAQPIGIGK